MQYWMLSEKKTPRRKNERKTQLCRQAVVTDCTLHMGPKFLSGKRLFGGIMRKRIIEVKIHQRDVQRSRADRKTQNSPSLFPAKEDIYHQITFFFSLKNTKALIHFIYMYSSRYYTFYYLYSDIPFLPPLSSQLFFDSLLPLFPGKVEEVE